MPKRQHKPTVPIWTIRKQSYDALVSGAKRVFLVPYSRPFFARLMDGERVRIANGHRCDVVQVRAVRDYASLEDALAHEDLTQICHGTEAQTYGYLDRIYQPEDWDNGARAVELVRP